ncbi:UspA domain-containing protein [uncultured Paludibacter sp.]|nr:UspA domain-containing protein [uncultured Paludibacter sp.]
MEDKLVTLAIRTYQRAQMIKTELEKNGIETVIHNLNTENPEVAVGVRVRIKESDLPRALGIVEKIESAWEKEKTKNSPKLGGQILIPIDLDDNIKEVCKYGFYFAQKFNTKVVFLHAYFMPAFNISSNNDINTYALADSEMIRRTMSTMNADVDNLKNLINRWISTKEVADVKFNFELKPGVPEDVILDYCKKENPNLVVMGTKGKVSGKGDMIGSVTAEVLEGCTVPVVAIPINGNFKQPEEVKKMAFLTNFDQKDLIAIDEAISLYKKDTLELFFIHSSDKKDKWDEVMLTGIKNYFANHYPNLKTEYALLKRDESLDQIHNYLKENRIDLVALNTKKRSLFARFFNQGIATRLLFNVDTPLLVMHM